MPTRLRPLALALVLWLTASGLAWGQQTAPAETTAAEPGAAAEASTTASTAASTAEKADDLEGLWQGAIRIPGQALEVRVRLHQEQKDSSEGWSGTIDIPAQGAVGLPLTKVEVDGAKARFQIAGVPGEPTFDGSAEGDVMDGNFTQMGATFPFRLERGLEEPEPPARPQTPEAPFPYGIEEVSYGHGNVHLAATLTLPEGEGPFPAVVLATGSGGQDRDSTIFGHRPFWVLADHLTRAGIAVLRADDRGMGQSTGHTPEDTTSDFADDALSGVRFLSERQEIDRGRIGIIGHSEGGMIAPLAASRSDAVAFVVMLAGLGVSGAEILPAQTAAIAEAKGLPAMAAALQAGMMRERIRTLIDAPDLETARARLVAEAAQQLLATKGEGATLDPAEEKSLHRQLAGFTSHWMHYFVTTDPADILRRVKVPTLAINGTLDLQVLPEQNLPPIEAALEEAGNEDVAILRLEGLNHLFQRTETGNPDEYGTLEETLAPELLEAVTAWILERFGPTSGASTGGD